MGDIHYRKYPQAFGPHTLCGLTSDDDHLTVIEEDVTCGRCKRSLYRGMS